MPPGEARERAPIAAFRQVADVARYITYAEAEKVAPEKSHPNARDPQMQGRNRAITYTTQEQVYAYFHRDGEQRYWVVTLSQAVKNAQLRGIRSSPGDPYLSRGRRWADLPA